MKTSSLKIIFSCFVELAMQLIPKIKRKLGFNQVKDCDKVPSAWHSRTKMSTLCTPVSTLTSSLCETTQAFAAVCISALSLIKIDASIWIKHWLTFKNKTRCVDVAFFLTTP